MKKTPIVFFLDIADRKSETKHQRQQRHDLGLRIGRAELRGQRRGRRGRTTDELGGQQPRNQHVRQSNEFSKQFRETRRRRRRR